MRSADDNQKLAEFLPHRPEQCGQPQQQGNFTKIIRLQYRRSSLNSEAELSTANYEL
jgi:hypothetical protein